MAQCRITEIFYSLQGETKTVGLPTVFVRLTGCPLRCVYCDTAYAFDGGDKMTLSEIVQKVNHYRPRYITVTGGEPLAQKHCRSLLTLLADTGAQVSLETSGAISIEDIDPRISIVMDIKTPSSGEVARNQYTNVAYLKYSDQVKFVIADKSDYHWACQKLTELQLTTRCEEILFSPVHGQCDPAALAQWIIDDNLPVRMQIQLHKYLWGEEKGR